MNFITFLLLFALVTLGIFTLIRFVFGRNSGLRHALVSALGVLMLYVVCILIYSFNPAGLKRFLAPLPFVTLEGTQLHLFRFQGASLPLLCRQLLSMLVLTFLVNLTAGRPGEEQAPLRWLLRRLVCILAALVLHYVIYRLLLPVAAQILPQWLLENGPVILLGVLALSFLLSLLKLILGLFLAVVNPLLGAVFGFFFVHGVGKQVSRAIGATAALVVFSLVLQHLGYGTLPIGVESLLGYLPFLACTVGLWYLSGHNM